LNKLFGYSEVDESIQALFEGTSKKGDLKYSRASVRWHLPATLAETNVL